MKLSRSQVRRKAPAIPEIKFERYEARTLSSFAGLALFQRFFAGIGLQRRLSACFATVRGGKIYSRTTGFLQLIVHPLFPAENGV